MGTLVISRREASTGKLRIAEPLAVLLMNRTGEVVIPASNAASWEDFLFHLGPVIARDRLHQADRDLRAHGTASVEIDDRIVDELWVQSFLLAAV